MLVYRIHFGSEVSIIPEIWKIGRTIPIPQIFSLWSKITVWFFTDFLKIIKALLGLAVQHEIQIRGLANYLLPSNAFAKNF